MSVYFTLKDIPHYSWGKVRDLI